MNLYVIRDKHGRYLMREARDGGHFGFDAEAAAGFSAIDVGRWIERLAADLPNFGLYAEEVRA